MQPPIPIGERILAFGTAGTRKTSGILDIASVIPDARFYVLDNEGQSYARLLHTDYQHVAERGNTYIANIWIDSWVDYVPQIEAWCRGTAKRMVKGGAPGVTAPAAGLNDWLVIDSMTRTWPAVQVWYNQEVFGEDTSDHLLALKKANKDDQKEYQKNIAIDNQWDVINPQYFKLYKAIMQWPGHVYMTADVKDLDRKNASKEQEANYGTVGVVPAGQKILPNFPHTVLLLEKTRQGTVNVTTVKDRGRRGMVKEPVNDFATDYLMGVAGWKMVRVD